jgi:tetratricopeptide (TPR) repeat protein
MIAPQSKQDFCYLSLTFATILLLMRHIYRLILFILFTSLLGSCGSPQKQNEHVSFSPKIDSIVHDTVSINYLLDSLKRKVRIAKTDTEAINALNELSSAYDKFNAVLVAEATDKSKKINYTYGITEAICRRGVYFERKYKFDTAFSYIQKSLDLAKKLDEKKNIALALSYFAESYKLVGDYDKAMRYAKMADSVASKINDKFRKAFSLDIMGDVYRHRSDFSLAQTYYKNALNLAEETGVKTLQAFILQSLGDIYRLQNDYVTALTYYNHALDLGILIKSKPRLIGCNSAIADVYHLLKDTTKSFLYFNKAIALAKEQKATDELAFCYSIMGETYAEFNQYDKAFEKFSEAMDLSTQIQSKNYISFLYGAIAEIYTHKGNYPKALDFFNKALAMDAALGDKNYLSSALKGMGDLYMQTGDIQKAKTCAQQSMDAAKGANNMNDISAAANLLSEVDEKMNDYKGALEMHKLYMKMQDSLNNEQNIKKFAAEEYRAKEENMKAQQEKEKAVLVAEDARKGAEVKKQKILNYAFSIGFVLVLLLAFFIYRTLQNNRKQTQIISDQKALVEIKNKELFDSITYAKRLQDAILPHLEEITKELPESFILYKPKDIVAGDFYWMEKVGNTLLIAACDCTGHGVPGALVSVVCSNVLNAAVKEFGITDPGKILDKARELLIKTFEKSGNKVSDGMDISLCAINQDSGKIQWAGANNPLWYVEGTLLKEVTPDKQPIGKYAVSAPFTTHTIQLKKGDSLYLFTDGFADQFGGPDGKKFKHKQLQEKIKEIAALNMNQQNKKLLEAFNRWKGKLEQVDDVLFMGIRI